MPEGWSVEDLGGGTHLFRWSRGFYASPFLVTAEGVVAADPIDPVAARAYREAIGSLTDRPVRVILYSHDHRDHIAGATELAPEAEIVAHPRTRERILARGDRDIPLPTRLVGDGDALVLGGRRIEIRYFGPNHSSSNLALLFPTARGRLLVFVDVVEPGVAPYRELPDTDFGGLLHSLDRAAELDFDLVMGGHCGPAGREWVDLYRAYFRELVAACREAYASLGGQAPLPGEDGVAMTERVRREACRTAAGRLRGRFGEWRGFEEWAPMNADRVLSFLITGN